MVRRAPADVCTYELAMCVVCILVLCLLPKASAHLQPQEFNSSIALGITGDGHMPVRMHAHTRQDSFSGQAVRSGILDHGELLLADNQEQLVLVKAASGFRGTVEALAAHLHADDDLVVEAKSNKLISRCSRLAATATPQQQAAARAAANDMAAAVVALQNTAGQEQPQQQQQAPWATTASTPFGFSDMQSSMSVTEAFKLSSRPGSKFKIVLDFDGNVLQDSLWNVIQETDKIVTQPYDKDGNPRTFNAEEIADIVAIWRAVAEGAACAFLLKFDLADPPWAVLAVFAGVPYDYAPFDVDVTTLDPGDAALRGIGQKVIIHGGEASVSGNNAGIAFIGGFGQGEPAFVCATRLGPNNPKYIWEAVSHEVGHTLGLLHDGLLPNPTKPEGQPYFWGQGNWAPIMGLPYYKQVTQFDAGEYPYASNSQDDLAVIGKVLPRLQQQSGSSFASAVALTPSAPGSTASEGRTTASRDGILTVSGQTDYMFFGADAGPATISVDVTPPFGKGLNNRANLKAAVALYDERRVLLQSLQPGALSMAASAASVQLPSRGIYYVAVSGAAEGSPTTDGYSSYGSLGWYTVSVSFRASAVDCAGAWSLWGPCSAGCMQTAVYNVTRPAANGGAACAVADGAQQTQTCSGGSCRPAAQNCVGSWGEWSSCSASCTQMQTYRVQQVATSGGAACPVADGSVQSRPCSGGGCLPANCVGVWGDWSSCSAACTQTSTFRVQQLAANGGSACVAVDGAVQTRSCSGGSCEPPPQDCMGDWGAWSSCSAACTQTKTYEVRQPAVGAGAACPAADGAAQTQPCSGGECNPKPQDCIGSWSAWSDCSADCKQTKTFTITQQAVNGGISCPVEDGFAQTQQCSGGDCRPPSQNCRGAWSDWSVCGALCTQTATYRVQQAAANGGTACPNADGAVQVRPCSGGCIPQNCVGAWGDWGKCSAACIQTMVYSVQQPAANGGAACPVAHGSVQWRSCSGGGCIASNTPRDCIGTWSDWGVCSASCTQAATYSVQVPAANGGAACAAADGAARTRLCTGGDCRAQDCVGGWESWSSCSSSCTQKATYIVTQPEAHGGAVCPAAHGTVKTQPCSGGDCSETAEVVHCVGAWSDWSSCNSACMQASVYRITQQAASGGNACTAADGAVQERRCSGINCIADASQSDTSSDCVGSWGDWSACSAACRSSAVYTVERPATNGGAACQDTDGAIREQPCEGDSCIPSDAQATDCVGVWGDWSSCSAACTQTQTYSVVQEAANNGMPCQFHDGAVQTQPCTGDSCLQFDPLSTVDCIGAWSPWSSCSASCTQTQTYTVTQPAANGGAACEAADGATQTQSCGEGNCQQATSSSPAMVITAINITREASQDSTGERYHCKAVVTLRSESGAAVIGARIHGSWAAPVTPGEPAMRVLDASAAAMVQESRRSGQAVFRSWLWRPDAPGNFCRFTVAAVSLPGARLDRSVSVTSNVTRWR